MDFEGRHEAWQRIIQSRAESVSQTLVRPDTCKVCTCLELLKLSLCPEHAHGVARQDFELLVGRLLGQVEEAERGNLAFELSKHEGYLNLVERLMERLSELQRQLGDYEKQIQNLELDRDRLRRSAESPADTSQFEELLQMLSMMEARVKTYEESLADLRTKNQDLNEQLKAATIRREDGQNQARILTSSLQNDFSNIRDEQQRLRITCETLSKQMAENGAQLNLLKERAEDRSGEDEMDQAFIRIKRENAAFLEEQRRSQEASSSLLGSIMTRYEELTRDLQATTSQIEKLSAEQRTLRDRQEECKTMSRHSNNLLTAADSVYSQHQELKDFQDHMNQCMDEMRRDIEFLKNQRMEEERRAPPLSARKESVEEWYHPGSFEYVVSLGRKCWSCCQTTQESRGCQRRK